jgi:predicted nucleic acid-binding protein
VTLAWCFSETDSAIVPALWLYKVMNVIAPAARKAHITERQAQDFLESLANLPIEIEHPTRTQMFVSIWALLRQHKLTAYDASYLELAIRHRLPIATFDAALMKAALDAGVNLLRL